jgi:hypothetical protein
LPLIGGLEKKVDWLASNKAGSLKFSEATGYYLES